MKSASLFFLFVAALPLAGQAQNATQEELLKRGELTGSRPTSSLPAQARAAARRQPASDPVQQHFLNSDVNLAQTTADQLPDLYERFIATTRDERRQWNAQQWEAAAQVLARLNQRYEQVRTDLPLEERLRIRSFQGEFYTLRSARTVKEKLD
ncbi:hypothetical protein [Hymenobacter armeniacus]|uniref:Uncharacterized protein n=1 Tax=Hymenobacter armeniacus TaxID=2771358 RepID=A0ABR8JPL0_9BACT|nr:hypothetical protein [Hymenobacter armeniacus]MBD2721935.1 hypothetical protein [Hymenobacter armeniacus]